MFRFTISQVSKRVILVYLKTSSSNSLETIHRELKKKKLKIGRQWYTKHDIGNEIKSWKRKLYVYNRRLIRGISRRAKFRRRKISIKHFPRKSVGVPLETERGLAFTPRGVLYK